MPVNQNDLLRVTLNYSLPQTVLGQNVFSYQFIGNNLTPDQVVLDDMGVVFTQWAIIWQSISAVTAVVDSVKVAVLVAGQLQDIGEQPINTAGVAGGGMLSHGAAPVLRALLIGGKGQARKFVPGMTENFSDESIITPLGLAALALLASIYSSFVGPATFPGVVETYIPGTFVQSVLPLFRTMPGDAIVNGIIGYQRRRKPGVGS